MATIESLTSEIKDLFASITTQRRLLKEEQIKAGHLLIQLRNQFGVKTKTGDSRFVRGKNGGTFCAHVLAQGWNLSMVYNYIAMAEGKEPNSPVRVQFWQTFNKDIKKAKTEARKIALLKKAVAHIVKLYGIESKITVVVG